MSEDLYLVMAHKMGLFNSNSTPEEIREARKEAKTRAFINPSLFGPAAADLVGTKINNFMIQAQHIKPLTAEQLKQWVAPFDYEEVEKRVLESK